MATSVGAAAAQGIESGFSLGLQGARAKADEEERRRRQANEDADRAERATDKATQRTREAKLDERHATQDKRLANADARQAAQDRLKMLDTEVGELATEGTALYSQHGGFDKVPEDVRADYTGRVRSARERRAAERRKFYEPDVQEQKRDAAEKWSRIQAGQMSLDQLSDDDLYRTLVVQTRRDMGDFLRPKEGGPSRIEQAALDLEAGMSTSNMDLTLRAANELLKPELSVGVGTESKDGSEIVSKRIVQLVPHPQDPSRFVPIVEVTVKRDDGREGKYLAPITENRSADPTDNVKTISLQDALDRVGQLNTLAGAVNRPDLRKRIEKGAEGQGKAAADGFLAALGSIGVTPPKRQIVASNTDLGDRVRMTERDASGNVVSEKDVRKGLAPHRGEGPTAAARDDDRNERGLKAAVARGDITEAEATEARRKKLLGTGGKGGMESPKAQFEAENKLRDEHTKQSGTFVKIRDAYAKTQAAAKDPSAAGDIALIFGFMRMLDPDSVVREGEFATAQNAASIPDRVRNAYNKALEGTRLNDKQRADMVQQARKVYAEQTKGQDRLDDSYRDMSKRYGLNTENVVQSFATEPRQLPADPKEADAVYARLPSGAVFFAPDGTKRTKP